VGFSAFIPPDAVDAFRKYKAEGFATMPKILAVGVARFGDDRSIIGVRQGRQYRILGKYRGLDLVQLADKVIEQIDQEEPDAVVIDGDGLGAGVVDIVKHRLSRKDGSRVPWWSECGRLPDVLQQAHRSMGHDARLA